MGRKLQKKTIPSKDPSYISKQNPKSSSSPVPMQRSPLLRLPGELRNRIFYYVLSHHTLPTTLTLHRDLSSPSVFRPSPHQPSLARICRQLRHELLSLFLGARTFILDREIGTQELVGTWSRILRPTLWHLRSVRFELFSEYTAESTDLQNGPCGVVTVHAWLTEADAIGFRVEGNDTCTCKFARCARDVERGVLGSPRDAPLIRLLKAWDLPAPPLREDRFFVCQGCGGANLQVSLRDIRRGRKANLLSTD